MVAKHSVTVNEICHFNTFSFLVLKLACEHQGRHVQLLALSYVALPTLGGLVRHVQRSFLC